MRICEQISSLPVRQFPAALVCAVLTLLCPEAVRAQSGGPTPVTEASTVPPRTEIAPAGTVVRNAAGALPTGTSTPVPSPDVGEALLSWALSSGNAPDGRSSAGDLGDFRDVLPPALLDDIVRLRDRVVRMRSRVFGRRGIVSFGQVEGSESLGRLRVNLQYEPDPGFRVTLITP